jgi:hypothetical protein
MPIQVIGNVKNDHHLTGISAIYIFKYSQLKKSEICIGIDEFVFTLLAHIFLEYGGGLGVVTVESIQDCVNIRWPIWRVVEGNTHN